ncbi:MAG: hypothetical protein ACI4DY_09655 [Monoglobaceae bacterium]
MGSYKTGLEQGLKEVGKKSLETTERAEIMNEEAERIDAELKEMGFLDSDNLEKMEEATAGYHDAFINEFQEQVEEKSEEIIEQGEMISEDSSKELDNIDSALASAERISGISEIGAENAESLAASLEVSEAEFQDIIDESDEVTSETAETVRNRKNDIEKLF